MNRISKVIIFEINKKNLFRLYIIKYLRRLFIVYIINVKYIYNLNDMKGYWGSFVGKGICN